MLFDVFPFPFKTERPFVWVIYPRYFASLPSPAVRLLLPSRVTSHCISIVLKVITDGTKELEAIHPVTGQRLKCIRSHPQFSFSSDRWMMNSLFKLIKSTEALNLKFLFTLIKHLDILTSVHFARAHLVLPTTFSIRQIQNVTKNFMAPKHTVCQSLFCCKSCLTISSFTSTLFKCEIEGHLLTV